MIHACLDCGFLLLADLEAGIHDCPNCLQDSPLEGLLMTLDTQTKLLSLGFKQKMFAKFLGLLICWVYEQGWELTMGEGFVGDTDSRDKDHDGPHLAQGAHYHRIGQDLNLFVNGIYITDGSHPAWVKIGEKWESYLPGLTTWGGRFGDSNHVSIMHNGIR